MKSDEIKKCNHSSQKECECICHQSYKGIIMHDHACCSPCFDCGFKEKCLCVRCNIILNKNYQESNYIVVDRKQHNSDSIIVEETNSKFEHILPIKENKL
jgi:hypothetical protein